MAGVLGVRFVDVLLDLFPDHLFQPFKAFVWVVVVQIVVIFDLPVKFGVASYLLVVSGVEVFRVNVFC